MFRAIVFALSVSLTIASPLLGGSNDWDTWFSSQSNAGSAQILPQSDSVSLENDMPYLSDLSGYQVDSGNGIFVSADESMISELGDPGTTVAYTGNGEDNAPMTEDLFLGPEAQATSDLESYAGQDQSAQLLTEKWDYELNPTPENPCPRLETYCCSKIQYAPILYVDKGSCKLCMNQSSKFD